MYAGSDVSMVPLVIRRAQTIVGDDWKRTDVEIRDILRRAYQQERAARATDEVLSVYGMDMQTFLAHGRGVFGDEFSALRQRIEQVDLGCEFMVAGRGANDLRSLFTVTNPGVIHDYTHIGFWAIGSGAWAALGALSLRKHNDRLRTAETMYHVCEAKFAAEASYGVGRDTFAILYDGTMRKYSLLQELFIEQVRSQWEAIGKPQPSDEAVRLINEWLRKRRVWAISEGKLTADEPEPSGS
jgi:hypothetical protein